MLTHFDESLSTGKARMWAECVGYYLHFGFVEPGGRSSPRETPFARKGLVTEAAPAHAKSRVSSARLPLSPPP